MNDLLSSYGIAFGPGPANFRMFLACYAEITDSSEDHMTATDRESTALFMRVTTLICFAILMAVPIYCVVAFLAVSQNPGGFVAGVGPSVAWILATIAVAQIPVAAAVSSALKRSAASKSTADDRLASLRVATIVGFALREGTAIIGLVITLLTGDIRWCIGLGALALLSMLASWPKRAEAEAMADDPTTAPIG